MWKIIVSLTIGLHSVIGGSSFDQWDTLDNCNWIYDSNPDDGTFIGWYSIADTPTDYCNGYNVYNASDEYTLSLWWYYECTDGGTTVTKYGCPTSSCDSGCGTMTTYVVSDEEFNCGGTGGSCLFKYDTFWQATSDGSCNDYDITVDVPYQTIWGVNGHCSNRTDPGESPNTYALTVCTNDGEDIQYATTRYIDDSTCVNNEVEWSTDWTYQYNCQQGYKIDYPEMEWNIRDLFVAVSECTGDIAYTPMGNGEINGLDCNECCAETKACIADSTSPYPCEQIADYVMQPRWDEGGDFDDGIPQCAWNRPQYDMYYFNNWVCNTTRGGSDCEASGFLDWFNCATENNCVEIIKDDTWGSDDSDSESNGDDCFEVICQEEVFDCFEDEVCFNMVLNDETRIRFDGNDNALWELHDRCDGQNCTFTLALYDCMLVCESDSGQQDYSCIDTMADDYDCIQCGLGGIGPLFWCAFDDECWTAFDATLNDVMNGICEENFCTPTELAAAQSVWCAANTPFCDNEVYQNIWNNFTACHEAECHWANCGTLIETCDSDPDCSEDLNFVVNIENNYNSEDDDFTDLVKNWYCSRKGGCHADLESAYNCVVTNGCLEFVEDSCYEADCKVYIDACVADGTCQDALFWIIGNNTECAKGLNNDYDGTCPADCDELHESDYTPCGFDSMGTFDDYEMCSDSCDEQCDYFIEIGQALCGNGECGTTLADLMTCVNVECSDTTNPDEVCWNGCVDDFVSCIFDESCYEDWQYIDNMDFDMDNLTYPAPDNCNSTKFYYKYFEGEMCIENMDEFMEEYFQCFYGQIVSYCEDDVVNPDGCDLNFWKMGNCMWSCMIPGIDTQLPTKSPSMEPTQEPTEFCQCEPICECSLAMEPLSTETSDALYCCDTDEVAGCWAERYCTECEEWAETADDCESGDGDGDGLDSDGLDRLHVCLPVIMVALFTAFFIEY